VWQLGECVHQAEYITQNEFLSVALLFICRSVYALVLVFNARLYAFLATVAYIGH